MKNKILVTGGNGLIGSQIKGDIKISSKDCDLRNTLEVENLFRQYEKIENVIHTAAKVGGLGSNISYKGEFFYDNIMMNTNIIEVSRKYNVKKMVCFLSTCIFPDKIEYPLSEDKIHLGPPHNSNYAYAYAKRMGDIQIRSYNEQYGLNYISLIPTNVYGPNDNFNLENGHVIPTLIHKCYLSKKNNNTLEIWGTGKPLREFIFSKDVANLTEWALKNYDDSEPLILSPSEEISIEHLTEIIIKYMNFNGKVFFDKTKPDGQYRKPTSNKKLLSYLPNFKFTSLEIGIQETIEWFNENYPNLRK